MIVIDIDMPKNCTECPLFDDGYGTGIRCCMVGSNGCVNRVDYDTSIKPKWCPIKCDIDDIKTEIEKTLQEPQYLHDGEDWMDRLIMADRIIDKHISADMRGAE